MHIYFWVYFCESSEIVNELLATCAAAGPPATFFILFFFCLTDP